MGEIYLIRLKINRIGAKSCSLCCFGSVEFVIDKINKTVFEEERGGEKVILAAQVQNYFLYLIDKYRLSVDIEILLIEKSVITLAHADRI